MMFRNSQWARILSAGLACTSLVEITGCTSVETQRRFRETRIESQPEGAEVWVDEGRRGKAQYVGATPYVHRQEYQVRKTTTYSAEPGIGALLGGFGIGAYLIGANMRKDGDPDGTLAVAIGVPALVLGVVLIFHGCFRSDSSVVTEKALSAPDAFGVTVKADATHVVSQNVESGTKTESVNANFPDLPPSYATAARSVVGSRAPNSGHGQVRETEDADAVREARESRCRSSCSSGYSSCNSRCVSGSFAAALGELSGRGIQDSGESYACLDRCTAALESCSSGCERASRQSSNRAAAEAEDSPNQPTGADGCSGCPSACSAEMAQCKGGSQSGCFRTAACLCQCNMAHGGCGHSQAELISCVQKNTESAMALGSNARTIAPWVPPPRTAPNNVRSENPVLKDMSCKTPGRCKAHAVE